LNFLLFFTQHLFSVAVFEQFFYTYVRITEQRVGGSG
jgi:hypothetical protein